MGEHPRKADGRRVFSTEFKRTTVQRILSGEKTLAEVSRECPGALRAELTVMSFTRAATLGLLVLVMVLVWPRPLAAAPVQVRFVQGSMHGFLVLHTANGPLLASGDL